MKQTTVYHSGQGVNAASGLPCFLIRNKIGRKKSCFFILSLGGQFEFARTKNIIYL